MYDARATGMRIEALRKQYGNSREEIAGKIGRFTKFYADIERGICGMSLDTVLDLADLYSVSLDYLVFGKGNDQEIMDNRGYGWRIGLADCRRKKAACAAYSDAAGRLERGGNKNN